MLPVVRQHEDTVAFPLGLDGQGGDLLIGVGLGYPGVVREGELRMPRLLRPRAAVAEVEPNFNEEYTAIDWYHTSKSAILDYQRVTFDKFLEKLQRVAIELGLI